MGKDGWNVLARRFHGSWWTAIGSGRGTRGQREMTSQGMGQEWHPWAVEKGMVVCVPLGYRMG